MLTGWKLQQLARSFTAGTIRGRESPGQHIHADAMLGQLRALGLDLGGARNTALRCLIQELPPTLVANAIGYSYQGIHQHAADAGVPSAGYARKGALPR